MAEPSNVEKLKQSWSQLNDRGSWLFIHIADTILDRKVTKMNAGKGETVTLRSELGWLADNFKALHNLNLRFRPGKGGEYPEGDLIGMLRRAEYNTAKSDATIAAMAGALKAMAGGATLDVDKLLTSIAETTKASFDEALKGAAPAEVTLKVEGAK